jgi:polar amino acid transport system permease protein
MRWDFLGNYVPLIVQATVLTIELSLVSFGVGLLLGFAIALARLLGGRDANDFLGVLVDLVRGTPLLVQLLVWYLGLSAIGFELSPFASALVGLTVNAAAFISEILRGAIRAVPGGQREAALAMALSPTYSVVAIELPQALPAIVPALLGFFIGLVKDTSLAYILGLYELTRTAKLIADREFRPLEIYVVIAIIYFALCFPLSRIAILVNRRLRRGGLIQERLAL